REEGLDNINGVLGEIDDTHLPDNSVDVAFLVDAYHEFSHPREMLQSIYDSLKPGGRLILVEYRAEDPNVPIRTLHKMTQRQVRREMSVLNFEWEKTLDFLPWQHMMFFTKPE
ncbi:MAG: methyltransferase domain-containing protein, partial [Pseudomonadota bacterium]